ncbi:Cof-type HAD-IIB family hydrolase [Corynebacterium sp. p3-SID1145]|uniref:HAD family hydrolase n=1 Tax=unclassified Corynebacterium TaxID=2624378 RepID=UPI0021AA37E6|nr:MULTISPECIES: HAD family hydrolase [unclassified Corynebacterium]MCT1453108.1 Cof-type HAD-IIB family hydrolase [Corynebacterium sp. p3-SID1145]MCT1462219.1 Cof-type HAD-IIB family hydrolase [Corynebacterium sp. p3-SID1140]
MAPKLIVSDIDGTLLDSNGRVSPRLRDTLARAVRGGTKVALATGRPHRWLAPVLDQLPFTPMCVCANGAVVYDPSHDEVLHRHELDPETLAEIAGTATDALEGRGEFGFGVERVGDSAFDPEDECFLITSGYSTDLWDIGYGVVTVDELVSVPAAKILVRHKAMTSTELFDVIAPAVDPARAHVTYSMNDGLIEVSAPGINKAAGVSVIAAGMGVDPSEVVAFGDMPNDIEMLSWAGLGVAMADSAPIVHDAADLTTTSNDDFGVARVIEQWF